MIDAIINEMKEKSSEEYAEFNRKIIKDGNCIIIGCRVPTIRKIAKEYCAVLHAEDIFNLLRSEYHEARIIALIVMIKKFQSGNSIVRENIVQMYLDNVRFVNNWCLVDISAYNIVGAYFKCGDNIFEKLSNSNSIWENRISIVSTYAFIKDNNFDLTLSLCKKFIKHEHHLIHKACGWMLRETGKRNEKVLLDFLHEYHENMPRIMLSYAKERLKNVQI